MGLLRKAAGKLIIASWGHDPWGCTCPLCPSQVRRPRACPVSLASAPTVPLLLGTQLQAPPSAPASVLTQLDPHPVMDAPQATPQWTAPWPRPLPLHEDPISPAQSLSKPIEAPHTVQGCALPPCGLPGCRSMRPSGREDETRGQRVRGHTEIPLLLSLMGHIWSKGFTTAGGMQCLLVRDLQGLVAFTAVRHPFTRKRGSVWTCQGPPRPGLGLRDARWGPGLGC